MEHPGCGKLLYRLAVLACKHNSVFRMYEVLSQIFRNGATIYTSVVVARRTGPKRQLWILGSAKFCGDCLKTCKDIAPNFGDNRPGCFTMTSPRLILPSSPSSFWWNRKWLSSPAHRAPLIRHPVTSSYFQKWNWSWKDAGTTEEIHAELQRVLNTLTEKDFQEAFQKRRRPWTVCMLLAGGN
jgi:hypothetical protein